MELSPAPFIPAQLYVGLYLLDQSASESVVMSAVQRACRALSRQDRGGEISQCRPYPDHALSPPSPNALVNPGLVGIVQRAKVIVRVVCCRAVHVCCLRYVSLSHAQPPPSSHFPSFSSQSTAHL